MSGLVQYLYNANGGQAKLGNGKEYDLPELPQGVVNFSAGLGDALLFGQGPALRRFANIDGGVDTTSNMYVGGEVFSLAVGGLRLAYAASAKTLSWGGSAIGGMEGAEFASAGRNTLKQAFRFGLFADYRVYSFSKIAAERGNDWNAIISAAGRTSPIFNWVGIQAGGGAATNRLQRCFGSGC